VSRFQFVCKILEELERLKRLHAEELNQMHSSDADALSRLQRSHEDENIRWTNQDEECVATYAQELTQEFGLKDTACDNYKNMQCEEYSKINNTQGSNCIML